MKKKIMTMLMLLAVSCMIMPTNAKAAKKAYIKTSTGSKATVFVGKTLKLNAKTVGKKKDIQLIGDIISIEHPIHENEFLNIATSLTGLYSNEGKVVFYNEFKKRSWTIFSFMANTFEEIGSYSDNYLLLSTKRKLSSTSQSLFGPGISIGTNKKGPDITDFIKENGFIPYYPKNIYSSQHFKHTDYFIHYGNFHLINKINSNIEISSINYIIKEELYEISYYDLQQSENNQNKNKVPN